MIKIGILLIATGRYINFVEQLYKSYEQHFLPNYSKKYFLLTDSDQLFAPKIQTFKINRLGFPGDTLYRFHHFIKIKDEIINSSVDVLYYSDVDMKAVSNIGTEILPTKENPFVSVAHPGFYYKNKMGTPETRKTSSAYIAPNEKRQHYICGGIQGGFVKNYLKASEDIKKMIDIDGKKNIIAVWHDESYWNRYMVSNLKKFKFMPPNYCHPEQTTRFGLGTLEPKILALDKNHAYFRQI